MNGEFQSRWADQMAAFVRFKNGLGFPYARSIATLQSFDRFAGAPTWNNLVIFRLSRVPGVIAPLRVSRRQ